MSAELQEYTEYKENVPRCGGGPMRTATKVKFVIELAEILFRVSEACFSGYISCLTAKPTSVPERSQL